MTKGNDPASLEGYPMQSFVRNHVNPKRLNHWKHRFDLTCRIGCFKRDSWQEF